MLGILAIVLALASIFFSVHFRTLLPFSLALPISAVLFYVYSHRGDKKIMEAQENKIAELEAKNKNTIPFDREQELHEQIRGLWEDRQELYQLLTPIQRNNPYLDDTWREQYLKIFEDDRLLRALSMDFLPPERIQIKAIMPSHTTPGREYVTSLQDCSCPDHRKRGKICKHMISLALFVNATYNMRWDVRMLLEKYAAEREKENGSQNKPEKRK